MSFDQVYWLGGITCSGKSTTAICIADRLGLELYRTDASFDLHLLRVRQDLHPTMYEFVVDARGLNTFPTMFCATRRRILDTRRMGERQVNTVFRACCRRSP